MSVTTIDYLKDKDGNIIFANDICLTPFSSKLLSSEFQPESSKREDLNLRSEFGCSLPINFNTSQGIKKMIPGKVYDENLNEI